MMIKGNVTLYGKISNAITTDSNRENEIYTHLLVKLYLPNKAGRIKECLVSVCKKESTPEDSIQYQTGTPVKITGQLSCRKYEKEFYMNLTADSITLSEKNHAEGISGEIEFYNCTGKAPEINADNHGYLYLSGFSTEQRDKECVSTWIRFIDFPEEQEAPPIKNNDIPRKGVLDILFYNSSMSLGYLFKETYKRRRTVKTE